MFRKVMFLAGYLLAFSVFASEDVEKEMKSFSTEEILKLLPADSKLADDLLISILPKPISPRLQSPSRDKKPVKP